MAFTRFHYDEYRNLKNNLETVAQNEYIFNIPGNFKETNVYIEDPHIRMQKVGNPQYSNMIDVNSELKNLNTQCTRDYIKCQYSKPQFKYSKNIITEKNDNITDESRSSHPAWTYRELCQYRPDHLFFNPQNHVTIKFKNNINTTLAAKDFYEINNKKI
jgi:hypothetical protein